MTLPFRDRHEAGRQLAEKLYEAHGPSTLVLGLPRGGVPVAWSIAHMLHAPLDVFLIRHLAPVEEPDAVFGCIGSGGVRIVRYDEARRYGLGSVGVDEVTRRERISLLARERTYRGQVVEREYRDQTVLLVDDGSATRQQLAEAVALLRQHEPRRIILAVPILSVDDAETLRAVVDLLVTVAEPTEVGGIDRWYVEYDPISHTEVRALLALALAEAQSRELAGAGGATP